MNDTCKACGTTTEPFGFPWSNNGSRCCVCGRPVCEGDCPVDIEGLGREWKPAPEPTLESRGATDHKEIDQ